MNIFKRLMKSMNTPFNKNVYDPYDNKYYHSRLKNSKAYLQAKVIKTVKNFEVVDKISGSFGDILVARDSDSKIFVLKSIDDKYLKSPQAVPAFIHEIINVISSNAYPVLWPEDVFWAPSLTDNDVLYIKLAYCAGGSLSDRLSFGPLNSSESIYHLLSIALALTSIHTSGFIHCNLKPENVLFNYDIFMGNGTWRTTVSDLGFSILTQSVRSRSKYGFRETSTYAAPEQLDGSEVSPAVDVWSWGIIAWLLLFGSHPFKEFLDELPEGATSLDLAKRIMSRPPDLELTNSQNKLNRSIEWLFPIVKSCLSIDPSDRPNMITILNSLRDHITLTTKSEKSGIAGHIIDEAEVMLKDKSGLLSELSTNYSWHLSNNITIFATDLGWSYDLKEAETYFNIGTPIALFEAIARIDKILGDWDEENSPLNQFSINPNKSTYHARTSDNHTIVSESDYDIIHSNIDISNNILLYLLDLKCICLANLASEFANPQILKEFRKTVEGWFKSDNFGVVFETRPKGFVGLSAEFYLCRLAQGFLLTGDLVKAEKIAAKAYEIDKNNPVVMITKRLVCHSLGEYQEARMISEMEAMQAYQTNNMRLTIHNLANAIFYSLDEHNIGAAIDILKKISGDKRFLIEVCKFIVRKRITESIEASYELDEVDLDIDAEMLIRYTEANKNFNPQQACYIAECMIDLGEYKNGKRIALNAMQLPNIDLPYHRMYKPFLMNILEADASKEYCFVCEQWVVSLYHDKGLDASTIPKTTH